LGDQSRDGEGRLDTRQSSSKKGPSKLKGGGKQTFADWTRLKRRNRSRHLRVVSTAGEKITQSLEVDRMCVVWTARLREKEKSQGKAISNEKSIGVWATLSVTLVADQGRG